MSDENESIDDILQFLNVYGVTPNPSTSSGLFPAELIFARKIGSVFDRLLPKENKKNNKEKTCKILYTRRHFL